MDNKEVILLILGMFIAIAGWFFNKFYDKNEASREKQNEALNKLSISMEKLVMTLERSENESKSRHEDVQKRISDNHEYMMAQFKVIYAEQTITRNEQILARKRYHDQQNLFTHLFLKMGLDEKAKEIVTRLKEEM